MLREILDGALDHAGRFRIALAEKIGEFLFAQFFARLVAQRIFARRLKRLAPLVDEFPERTLAGLIADEAFLVLYLHVVTIDRNAG